jgi:uncharacterized protein (DUF1697 family)
MTQYIALLRGINIGAKKRIAMADLRALVEGLGHTGVRTYVNSGNVVFTAGDERANTALAGEIETALNTHHGLDVPVVVRSAAEMQTVVAGNPFPEVEATPKLLHVSFLGETPAADRVAALADVERGDDEYRVVGQDIYLHYPNGLANATFMLNGFDRALRVTSTSRNWNTVVKLAAMAAIPA